MKEPSFDQTSYNYCALPLASYACRPDRSRGRIYAEAESPTRTCFQRDRDRIIHCGAFRRLKYKTQVFVYHEGDHYRTRLTHTLEVAQIARSLARALMVNEDLAETVALAHDLGHTPFAHVGEDVMEECMKDVGGFDHNDQSLRILTFLERRYPKWPGLNLTWETLEGVAKHNGPLVEKGADAAASGLPVAVTAVNRQMDLQLHTFASLEAQVAALADDIAYNNHDVEDGLRAGLFTLDDLRQVPLLADIIPAVEA
ncbi:MAG: dNTP triphosphohydrolase, partial [Micavibrio aeruginosavorus]|nr:dNTP triphosphohydrolase [Micavibrio aeruginosavorus]